MTSVPPPPPPAADAPDGRVTVAVITRDRPRSVLRTLDALSALPERPPVIVVDNGSDAATTAAVRRHPATTRLVEPHRNTGALGRNLAARHADTPYVAFSDDDSWWAPGALRQAADLLDTHPRLGLVTARTLVGPDHTEDPLNTLLAASPLPAQADLPGQPVLGFLACAGVVRKDAFLAVGGFHPLLFFNGEETLLAYDLTAAGWGVTYVPTLTAHHHPEPSSRHGRSHLARRNEVLTRWLRRPLRVALRSTTRLAADALAGRPGARHALREVIARLPAALARRRRLPPHVEHAARLLDEEAARTRTDPDDTPVPPPG
ncbi:glycosyltransferase family 2 protein [Streptomyces sp. YS415]|uniref:glycosyltransferase family 2 protein n=1 Tax=Streptomyces sp. YS415 TaxID=2944806 RepID=UPI00201FEE70|nr:glycosyltransferase [Streptomyces sp. YS415]MCL7424971.1 glycosyltransferase [Streptomyces sp. YS415]